MKIAMQLSYAGGFHEAADEVAELERAGLDLVWVAEAWGFDAPSLMGFLAARTSHVRIASGILPIFTRTPTLLAMTAAGVDFLSNGRAVLGLGASGPQVIEGWHGVAYDAPVGRTREIIAICRKVWRREKLEHHGRHYELPLGPGRGTGLGKALHLITHPVRPEIPIVVASLGRKSVEMTAELADGWLPVLWHPTRSRPYWGEALAGGLARRDASRGPLEVFAGGPVAIGEGLEGMRDLARPMLALYVGGMGARGRNFYNDVFAGLGYADAARTIQDLYLSGRKAEAAAAVPGSFLAETSLIGPEGFVRDRIAALRESGVTTLNVALGGRDRSERVRTLDRLRNLAESL